MGSKATWNSLWVFERAENNQYKRMFFSKFFFGMLFYFET